MNLIFFLLACGSKQTDTSSESTDTAETNEPSQPSTEPAQPSTEPSTEPSGEPVEPNPNALTSAGGCSDYFVYAHDEADTQTIHVIGSGLAQQAHEQGEPLSISYSINPNTDDIQPTIRFQTGENLNHVSCNDAIIPGMEPVVTHEWTAISGSVSVTVTPNGDATDWGEYPADVEILMENIELSDEQGDSFILPEKTITTFIGWMPG